MTERKKLIEVALPLEAINRESAREKSIRHGHPSTLHIWWARRPLAACRAVIFASLVDDPSSHPERFPTEDLQEAERRRLFEIIERLVRWENTTNEAVLEEARAEIRASTAGTPPPLLDPFCGGGSIPMEAQRLGLDTYASDLNPIAVLITKALIEIPPRFAGCAPAHPDARRGVGATGTWKGASGLAEDVRRYGSWMRDEAARRIGDLYPKAKLSGKEGGGEARVIAWLWAWTLKCPNPACGAQMPLIRSFVLSNKGRRTWIDPIVDREQKRVSFGVRAGTGTPPPGTVGRQGARCIVCTTPVPFAYVRAEGRAGRMAQRMTAVVAEATRGRIYLPPTVEEELLATSQQAAWRPTQELPHNPRDFKTPNYGMTTFADLFTPRQLVALTTFSDEVLEVREIVRRDAEAAGFATDRAGLAVGGSGAAAYADAVALYLAFAVDRSANYWSRLTPWGGEFIVQTFGRQALPMVWDHAEVNPFSGSTGNWDGAIQWIAKVLEVSAPARGAGAVDQLDAAAALPSVTRPAVVTDPPYYDNIGYADLSDFFYVWLRRSIGPAFPDLFSTVLTPKANELVATPYRFGGDKRRAEEHFERGLMQAFARIRSAADPDIPVTLFYAFKQTESDGDGANIVSTGWATMLRGLLESGFSVVGTWPMRTERDQGLKTGSNVLASSILLVCRPRIADNVTTRRDFVATLHGELGDALRQLQKESIAPVDLAQSAIGPGMAVFSRFAKVIEPDGSAMTVRSALGQINSVLDQILAEQEGEFDSDTRWAITWFEQYAMNEGVYGVAETLSKARDTSVSGLERAGIIKSGGGKVRLLRREELPDEWNPATDRRPTVWEATQHLVRALEREGETGAGQLAARIGGYAELARDLAYRLYLICDRKSRAEEALSYNQLVVAWPEIERLANAARGNERQQTMHL